MHTTPGGNTLKKPHNESSVSNSLCSLCTDNKLFSTSNEKEFQEGRENDCFQSPISCYISTRSIHKIVVDSSHNPYMTYSNNASFIYQTNISHCLSDEFRLGILLSETWQVAFVLPVNYNCCASYVKVSLWLLS